jgi:hypothetical protein
VDLLADLGRDAPPPLPALRLCAQYVTREDELWMRGLCPRMRSLAVRVFCCHRNASGHPFPVTGPVAPCVSFVVETDTCHSILHRIASVAWASGGGGGGGGGGAPDMAFDDLLQKLSQYELVMYYNGAATVLPSGAANGAAGGGSGGGSGGAAEVPWDIFRSTGLTFNSGVEWKSAGYTPNAVEAGVEVGIVMPDVSADGPRKRRNLTAGIKIR